MQLINREKAVVVDVCEASEYAAGHVAGAKHAPLYFVSAFLFSADINTLYEAVQCPVWVSMATRGDFTDYQGRTTVAGRSNWQFHAIEGGALPYFEDLPAFNTVLDPYVYDERNVKVDRFLWQEDRRLLKMRSFNFTIGSSFFKPCPHSKHNRKSKIPSASIVECILCT